VLRLPQTFDVQLENTNKVVDAGDIEVGKQLQEPVQRHGL